MIRTGLGVVSVALVLGGCGDDDPVQGPGKAIADAGSQAREDGKVSKPDSRAHEKPDRGTNNNKDSGLAADMPPSPPPKPACAASPLDLTRFPKAARTTAGGRTFTGWGGAAKAGKAARVPVIFIHGNGGTADDWKSIRSSMCKGGYGDNALWAITFQDNDCSGYCTSGSNTHHAAELARLVELVKKRSGASKVNLVAVSMGVPAARYYMKALGGIKRDEIGVAYFVSGPNHGLKLCDAPGAAMINVACAELYSGSLWLNKLNKPDETPSGVGDGQPANKTIIYRTVSYTGDHFFPGKYVSSPKLSGADNWVINAKAHAAIYMQDLLKYLNKAKL